VIFLQSLSALAKALSFIAYPPFCLGCDEPLETMSLKFCPGCQELFQLINPSKRCRFCFANKGCLNCTLDSSVLEGFGACFDPIGPPKTLLCHLEHTPDVDQVLLAASFMTAQLVSLNWPFPDVVIPVPQTTLAKVFGKTHLPLLLAKQVGLMINRPVYNPLYQWVEPGVVKRRGVLGKKVLMIDTSQQSKDKYEELTSILLESGAEAVFGLTLIGSLI
jgi:hypothetical protein